MVKGSLPKRPRRMRIIVTRPRDQSAQLVKRLEALGHEVVSQPLIEIVPIDDGPVSTDGYDWVVVTSPNGAEQLARRRHGPLPRVAAIGPGTAEALAAHGIDADLVPRMSTQEGLLAEFPRPPGRVLFAGAEGARRLIVDELGADFVPLYRTEPRAPEEPLHGDLVVLASPSSARAYAGLRLDIPAVSIGPETTAAAEAAGVRVVAEAGTHDLDGLVAAVQSGSG
jgi:uroporphyrinogen III methyltransferase / synthase